VGEARDTMNRLTEAVFGKDMEAMKALYAPDAVVETPDQGVLRGRDAIAAYVGELMAAFPDASYEAVHEHESGDVAIDEGFMVGTHTGPLAGPDGEEIAPTGKSVRLRACDVATVRDGLVTEWRLYFDQMDFLAQLGLLGEGDTGSTA
jgi:ketosteroid isomerase-like protein